MVENFDVTKGNRDWYGSEAILREHVKDSLRRIFERYGYDPIETPVTEFREALAFKGGGEIQKEVFQLEDQGGRRLALRFDQTVPLARFVATHRDITFPFKRSVIGPVFRDGPTQPDQGRYRQFTQCDVDVLGIKEMAAEAELLALAQDAFEELGLGGVEVKLNHRKLLDGVLDYAGIPDKAKLRTIVTLDKMDKIGLEGVREALYALTFSDKDLSLSNKTFGLITEASKAKNLVDVIAEHRAQIFSEVGDFGFAALKKLAEEESREDALGKIADFKTRGEVLLERGQADNLLTIAGFEGDNESAYAALSRVVTSPQGLEGLKEVRQILDYSKAMGFSFVRLDPSLARGLDYYTGPTIEVYLKDKSVIKSAILAGGRFDNMVGDFRGGEEIPAVGFSFGLERLVTILGNKNGTLKKTNTQIYLIPMGTTDQCLRIAHDLRRKGVNVDIQMQPDKKLGKSIAYANERGIPYVGVIGDNEIRDGTVSVKNLSTRKQEAVQLDRLDVYIQSGR